MAFCPAGHLRIYVTINSRLRQQRESMDFFHIHTRISVGNLCPANIFTLNPISALNSLLQLPHQPQRHHHRCSLSSLGA